MKLQWQKTRISHPGGILDVAIPPLDAVQVDDKIIVVHDYMAYPPRVAAPNLVAYNVDGEQLWVAENPGAGAADAYTNVLSESPLRVHNFAGYLCTIDPMNGKLLRSEFIK